MWNCEITWFSHFSILFSHFGARNPGPGPKAAAGQARPGPFAAALGPRPGSRAPKCANNMKIIWNKYKDNVISNFHMISTFFSHYLHIFITFWVSGPRSGFQKSYFCHIPGHICFIVFSYFGENLVFRPVHTDNLYNSMPKWQQCCKRGQIRWLQRQMWKGWTNPFL